MKKILMLISIVIIGVALVGCKSSEKVQEDKVENDDSQIRKVITSYLEDGKKLDLESMSKKEKTDNNPLTDSKEEFVEDKELMISIGQEISKTLRPYTKETKFDIKNVKVDGNNANVQTEVKYLDFSLPVENAFANMDNVMMSLMYKSGGDTSEDDMLKALIENSKENIEANIDAYGKEYNTVNIDFKMEKVNDKWLIADYDDDALLNILTLNTYSVVDKEFGGNREPSSNEAKMKEVTLGKTFKLGPNDIVINSIKYDTESAEENMVIVDLTWTNKSDKTISWSSNSDINIQVFQDGIELQRFVSGGNSNKDIRPNITLENIEEQFVITSQSDIELEMSYSDSYEMQEKVFIILKVPQQ